MNKIICSHKKLEWVEYKRTKVEGDGNFPPTKYCAECAESYKLKFREQEK